MDLASFSQARVIVIGDLMLDRYHWGSVSRISPEAPVPIVFLNDSSLRVGGAANVAANIAALGATPLLIGVIGTDADGREFLGSLKSADIKDQHILTSPSRKTTVKTRIIAHGQHVVRLDSETNEPLSDPDEEALLATFDSLLDSADAVIVSDYGKGVTSTSLVKRVIEKCNGSGKPVLIDPKGKDYEKYHGATVLTPNRKEAADATKIEEHSPNLVSRAGELLLNQVGLEYVLITESEDGMTLFAKDGSSHHFDAASIEVFDVTGAGDTVIACLGVALASGFDYVNAVRLSNIAGGLSVQKIGTSPVSIADLAAAVTDDTSDLTEPISHL